MSSLIRAPISGRRFLSFLSTTGVEFTIHGDSALIQLTGAGALHSPGPNLLRFARKGYFGPPPVECENGGVLICDLDFTPRWPGVVVYSKNPELLFRYCVEAFGLRSNFGSRIGDDASWGDHSRVGPGWLFPTDFRIEVENSLYSRDAVEIGIGVVIRNALIGEETRIGPYSVIGAEGLGHIRSNDGELVPAPHFGGVRIGRRVYMHSGVVVDRAVFGETSIGDGCVLGARTHVSHGVQIGKDTFIAHGVEIGGSTIIGEGCTIWSGAVIRDNVEIGKGATVGMGSVVLRDVPDDLMVVGNPARQLARRDFET